MKKVFVLLAIIFCFTFLEVTFATDGEVKINSNSGEENSNSKSGEVKAEIYLRPEDAHPNGVNIEIGTASFWLEVGARISGESGEVSYQWYESPDGSMENIKKVEGETEPIFIPEQKIGTTYYCAGVITTVDGKSTTEYTKLLEATFTPKMIDEILIIGVKEPVVGEKVENKAEQYTDYDLNSYYGYEITSVNWTPNDTEFKEGQVYKVDIGIEYWDNVEFATKLDVKVNNKDATIESTTDGKGATVSYTFEKLQADIKDDESGEFIDDKNANSGEELNENSEQTQNEDNTKIEASTVVLITIFVILIVFSLMIIIKKK